MATTSLTPAQLQAAATGITVHVTVPANPVIGSAYFDTAKQGMMVWTGQAWTQLSGRNGPYILFIDDLRTRNSVDFSPRFLGLEVLTARTCEEAINMLEHQGLPTCISFDHDLGEGQPPATHIMWHLINGHLDEKWNCGTIKTVQVHSANPVGAKNLLALWRGFCNEFNLVMDTCQVEAKEPK